MMYTFRKQAVLVAKLDNADVLFDARTNRIIVNQDSKTYVGYVCDVFFTGSCVLTRDFIFSQLADKKFSELSIDKSFASLSIRFVVGTSVATCLAKLTELFPNKSSTIAMNCIRTKYETTTEDICKLTEKLNEANNDLFTSLKAIFNDSIVNQLDANSIEYPWANNSYADRGFWVWGSTIIKENAASKKSPNYIFTLHIPIGYSKISLSTICRIPSQYGSKKYTICPSSLKEMFLANTTNTAIIVCEEMVGLDVELSLYNDGETCAIMYNNACAGFVKSNTVDFEYHGLPLMSVQSVQLFVNEPK